MILLKTFCKNYFYKIFIFTLLIKLYKVKIFFTLNHNTLLTLFNILLRLFFRGVGNELTIC